MKKHILIGILGASMLSSTLAVNDVFAYCNIRALMSEGYSTEEILNIIEKEDSRSAANVYVTVKSGTELSPEYMNNTAFTKVEDKYLVYMTIENIKKVMNEENVLFVEFYPEPTNEETIKKNLEEIRQIALTEKDGPYTGIFVNFNNAQLVQNTFKNDPNVCVEIVIGNQLNCVLKVPNEEVEKYIQLIESSNNVNSVDYTNIFDAPLMPSEINIGDLNSDGKTDLTDLSELSLALVGDKELTEAQQKAADVDGDGAVKLADLAKYRQYLSKVISSLG